MANLAGYLICPKCQNKNQFTIHATVEVHVQGANYLAPFAEGGRSYGSSSLCVCAICEHVDKLDAFIGGVMGGVMMLSKYIEELDSPAEDRAGATIYPIRPAPG
jgi:hypothetical protein